MNRLSRNNTEDSLNEYLDQLNLQNRDYMIEYLSLKELERRLRNQQENHNRGDISTGNLFVSVKTAGITDEVVRQVEECFYGDGSDSFMFEGKGD